MATNKKAAPKKSATETATTAKAAPQPAPRQRATKQPQPGSDPEHPIYSVGKTVIALDDRTLEVLGVLAEALGTLTGKLQTMQTAPAPTATAMQAAPVQQPAPVAQPVQQPTQQPAATATTTGPTLTQLREGINAKATTPERTNAVLALLGKYGASSASTLAEENYAAFYNDLNALQ